MNDSGSHPNVGAEALVDALKSHTDISQRSSNTGQFIIANYGARLLGLYPRANGPNVLWVNPALQETLAVGEWLTGGERLWLAPERDFFYQNPADFEGVHIPAAIDPGHYTGTEPATSDDAAITLQSTFDLYDFSRQQRYSGSQLTRTFQSLEDPYHTGLDYVGVQIHDQVTIPNIDRRFCAWSIAQVYIPRSDRPATTLIPTLSSKEADILSYFDAIPRDRAEAKPAYIRFKLDAGAIYKLAVRPEHLDHSNPVKALCLAPCPEGDEWFCVVKRSRDVPLSQSQCLDVARNPQTAAKGAVQSYNHGPQDVEQETPHAFGEIEIQLMPSTADEGDIARSAGHHELLAYSGSHTQIMALAQRLLQLNELPTIYN